MSAREPFDAKRARANRPFPLWVDAISRKTALLSTDEFGAYIKILMAMWSSREAALPNDPRKLARAAGVTLRLWTSRIGPALEGFWTLCDEGITQKRLREEAAYIEAQCKAQSDKKRGAYAEPVGDNKKPQKDRQKKHKPLKSNNPAITADKSDDQPQIQPTQQPNNPTLEGEEGIDLSIPPPPSAAVEDSDFSIGVDFLERIAKAAGYSEDGIPDHWTGEAAEELALSWRKRGLSEDAIIDAIRRSRSHHREPPHSPQALKAYVEAEAGRKPTTRQVDPIDPEQIAAFWEGKIDAGKFVAPSSISAAIARLIVSRGKVSAERLKELGIAH